MPQQLAEPAIVVRGDVPENMVAYAREKLLGAVDQTARWVRGAEARLDAHADPAREGRNHVEMTADLDGDVVRARFSAPTISEAVDGAAARLRRRVQAADDRPEARRLRHRESDSWHHGDALTGRPPYFPRPEDERTLVRRKTFAMRPESIEEALFDLEVLDHDFFLFVHDETGAEAVVHRVDGGYGLRQRVPTPEAVERAEMPLQVGAAPATTTVEQAMTVLDESGAPFEFFVDEANGRGAVVYRRYDGHYGLVAAT